MTRHPVPAIGLRCAVWLSLIGSVAYPADTPLSTETDASGSSVELHKLLPTIDPLLIEQIGVLADSATNAKQPLDPAALQAGLRGLVGVTRLDRRMLAQLETTDPSAAGAPRSATEPLAVVRVQGTIKSLRAVDTPEPWAEVADLPRCWFAMLEAAQPGDRDAAPGEDGIEQPDRTVVMLANVPAGWLPLADGRSLDQPVEILGVRVAGKGRGGLILGHTLRWFPRSAGGQPPVTPSQALLGQRGLDVAALLAAQARNQLPLDSHDGPPLQSLLRIAEEPVSNEMRAAAVPFDLAQVLVDPAAWAGAIVNGSLQMRRATRIELSATEAREAHSDHYWQVDTFATFAPTAIRLQTGSQAKGTIDFRNRFPVTVLVRDLPKDWASGNAQAVMLDRDFDFTGVHYRLWGYETPFAEQAGASRQWGPLIVAFEIRPRPIAAAAAGSMSSTGAVVLGLLLGLVALAAIVWWSRRLASARSFELPDRLTLPQLDGYSKPSARSEADDRSN
jgi:hypothetical protein